MNVLIVEDNRRLAEFLVRAFSEEGWTVDQVGDGATALDQIEHVSYDLVVLDWMLPRMDGVAVARELRSRNIQVPILMLTARNETGERILGLDAGADDYLGKPFDLGELLARARALVRRAAPHHCLRVGVLSLDLAGHVATLGSQRLELTAREFAILHLLMREAGRPVSRAMLLAKVWGATADPGTNVIDVHVKNLRDKLAGHADMLETVRGVGYRLSEGE